MSCKSVICRGGAIGSDLVQNNCVHFVSLEYVAESVFVQAPGK